MQIKFSDGMIFDTAGAAKPVHKSDGWYVSGKGMLIPCADDAEAKQVADEMNGIKAASGPFPPFNNKKGSK